MNGRVNQSYCTLTDPLMCLKWTKSLTEFGSQNMGLNPSFNDFQMRR